MQEINTATSTVRIHYGQMTEKEIEEAVKLAAIRLFKACETAKGAKDD